MKTDTAGNPIFDVPSICGRCGAPTDTAGRCTALCQVPVTDNGEPFLDYSLEDEHLLPYDESVQTGYDAGRQEEWRALREWVSSGPATEPGGWRDAVIAWIDARATIQPGGKGKG